jgi:two-component system sensor histidine kinase DesK
VLALVVREATTNILRHSSATSASIRLESTTAGSTLEIENNASHSRADAAAQVDSSGLVGLRDRVSALDGTLGTAVNADRFALRVFVPAKVGTEA